MLYPISAAPEPFDSGGPTEVTSTVKGLGFKGLGFRVSIFPRNPKRCGFSEFLVDAGLSGSLHNVYVCMCIYIYI